MTVKNIYIIEDDAFFARGFSKKLEIVGECNIRIFDSAEAALLNLAIDKPEIIFLDHLMGGLNGVDALPTIKAIVPNANVVIVSNVRDVHIMDTALNNGAAKYFTKDALLMNKTNEYLQEIMDRPSGYVSFWKTFFQDFSSI